MNNKERKMDRKEINKIVDRLVERIDNLKLLGSYDGICCFNENIVKKEDRTIPNYKELLKLMKDDKESKENLNKIFESFFQIMKKVFSNMIEDVKIQERIDNFVSLIKYITDNLEDDDALRIRSFNEDTAIFANGNAIESWVFPDVVANNCDEKERLKDTQGIIDSLRGSIRYSKKPENCPSLMFFKEEES